eukprot:m.282689 g.282689  ORF g.282689 m.282689 type:complete len:658 (-) comp19858_c0_seq2:209-2182(-)
MSEENGLPQLPSAELGNSDPNDPPNRGQVASADGLVSSVPSVPSQNAVIRDGVSQPTEQTTVSRVSKSFPGVDTPGTGLDTADTHVYSDAAVVRSNIQLSVVDCTKPDNATPELTHAQLLDDKASVDNISENASTPINTTNVEPPTQVSMHSPQKKTSEDGSSAGGSAPMTPKNNATDQKGAAGTTNDQVIGMQASTPEAAIKNVPTQIATEVSTSAGTNELKAAVSVKSDCEKIVPVETSTPSEVSELNDTKSGTDSNRSNTAPDDEGGAAEKTASTGSNGVVQDSSKSESEKKKEDTPSVQAKEPPQKPIEYIVIDDDGQDDPPLFPQPPEAVQCTTTLHGKQLQPGEDGIRLILTSEVMTASVEPTPINLPNLAGRSFLDICAWFDPTKMYSDNSLRMKLGPYVAVINRSGTIQVRGKLPSKTIANQVLKHVLNCAAASGEALTVKSALATTSVTASASIGRTILMNKLARMPGCASVKAPNGPHVEVVDTSGDAEAKVAVWSTGKVTVHAPTRVRAQMSFLAAMDKVRACVVVTSGDHKRRRSTDPTDAAKKARRRSSESSANGTIKGERRGSGPTSPLKRTPTPIASETSASHAASVPPTTAAQSTAATTTPIVAAGNTTAANSVTPAAQQVQMDVDAEDSSSGDDDELVEA